MAVPFAYYRIREGGIDNTQSQVLIQLAISFIATSRNPLAWN